MWKEKRKCGEREGDIELAAIDEGTAEELVAPKVTNNDERSKEGNFFSIKAAVIGLWIPCVIGKTDYTFKMTSVTSFTARTLALIVSFILAIFNVVPSGSFLLFCSPHSEKDSCYSIQDCFKTTNATIQKTRFCEDTTEDPAFRIMAGLIIVSGIFSMLGSYVLSKMSEYDYMFTVSRNCCWCLPCPLFPCCLTSALSPIIHRTLIFTVLDKNGDAEGAEKLKEIFDAVNKNEENVQTIASRPLQGETPLMICVKENKTECATVLLTNGAKIEENSAGEYPINIACGTKDVNMMKVLLDNGGEIKEDKSGEYPVNISFENKDMDMLKVLLDNGGEIK